MIHWGQIPIVAARLNERISGDPKIDHFEYTKRKYIDPMRKKHGPIKMLSVCCGVGQLEREMLKNGFCDEVLAYDVSAPCIEQANALAAAEGLGSKARFVAADLNSLKLAEDESFDVVFNEAALHHISNLEHLIQECRRVCKPHSVFVNHDFIGPNHHQWTERQLSIINSILSRLPNPLKGSRTNPGAIHFSRKALSMAEMLDIDPTEGVRSQDTLPVMQRWFDIVERKDFGGTILHILFNDIAGNFMAPEHDALVKILVYLEDLLLETADLPSDFSYWVARPRD